jgi:hypothetical protein
MKNDFSKFISRAGISKSTILDMANWLFTIKRGDITSDSWRLYRAALLSTVELNPDLWSPSQHKEIRLRLYEKSDKIASKKRPLNTAKNLSKIELENLSKELKNPRRTYGIPTLLWFKSSLLTGLRPNEWMNAEIITIEGDECLKVKNLKVMEVNFASLTKETSGRSRFLYRTIPLDGFSTQEKQVVRAWVIQLRGLIGSFTQTLGLSKEVAEKELYERCRKTLYAAYKASSPEQDKGVSLYTARHVFKVNNKQKLLKGGMSKNQADIYMAILMGHGSTKSNYAYGTGSSDTDASTINIDKLALDKENFLRRVLTKYD